MADIEYRVKATDLHDRMSPYKSFYASYEENFPHVALNISLETAEGVWKHLLITEIAYSISSDDISMNSKEKKCIFASQGFFLYLAVHLWTMIKE
jgi:hypothetical protein